MHMIRYQPWGAFDLMDRLAARHAGHHTQEADWTPSVDIKEEAERFVIHADVPGVDPKDIEISMEDGVLSLSGERKSDAYKDVGGRATQGAVAETRDETNGWARVERKSGRFLRRFTLPEGTDAEGISAQGNHGVLEIVIPKAAKPAARKIAVKVN
ncbi:MAG TPA: Hsp20/alpha crystallin family protein [Gammaproteobacteria bacterium]